MPPTKRCFSIQCPYKLCMHALRPLWKIIRVAHSMSYCTTIHSTVNKNECASMISAMAHTQPLVKRSARSTTRTTEQKRWRDHSHMPHLAERFTSQWTAVLFKKERKIFLTLLYSSNKHTCSSCTAPYYFRHCSSNWPSTFYGGAGNLSTHQSLSMPQALWCFAWHKNWCRRQ